MTTGRTLQHLPDCRCCISAGATGNASVAGSQGIRWATMWCKQNWGLQQVMIDTKRASCLGMHYLRWNLPVVQPSHAAGWQPCASGVQKPTGDAWGWRRSGFVALPAVLCPHDGQQLRVHLALVHARRQRGDAPGGAGRGCTRERSSKAQQGQVSNRPWASSKPHAARKRQQGMQLRHLRSARARIPSTPAPTHTKRRLPAPQRPHLAPAPA